MILSSPVKDELHALRLYYKSLYFFRWLLPTSFKNGLSLLARINLDTERSETAIASCVNPICHFFYAPKWYARLLIFWLPGLRQFSTGAVMTHAKRLKPGAPLSTEGLNIMIQYEPLQTGVLGVQLLLQHHLAFTTRKERVDQLLNVMQCKLPDDLNSLFYQAIAQRADVFDFATPIASMQTRHLADPILLKHLLISPTPMQYAEALQVLNAEHLLPINQEPISGDLMDPEVRFHQLKAEILSVIVKVREPLSWARAVVNLNQHHVLDQLTFDALKTSQAPTDLADLMVQFESRLDQQIVPQLEAHRKNRALIARVHQPSEDRTLDLKYSTNLGGWIAQQTQPCSQLAFALYDHYYRVASETSSDNTLLAVLSQINQQRLFEGELKQGYYEFLTTLSSRDALETYASVLLILNATPELVTVDSQTELLALVKSCKNPNALLVKMRPANNKPQLKITQAFLKNVILIIHRDIERAQSSGRSPSRVSSGVQRETPPTSMKRYEQDVEATGGMSMPTGCSEDVESGAVASKATRYNNSTDAVGVLGTLWTIAKHVIGGTVADSDDENEQFTLN